MLIALLTLIVTLYDRYRNLRVASFSMVRPSAAATAPA